jgi:hypothetical protein
MISAARIQPKTEPELLETERSYATSIPPDPGEEGASSVRWETRGILGRLVRIDPPRLVRDSGDRRAA